MGAEVSAQSYSREQRQRYREKVRQNLDVFERMLNTSSFEFDRADDRAGDRAQPRRRSTCSRTSTTPRCSPPSPTRTTRPSSAQYNIELNVPPRPLPGDSALELEAELRASLNRGRPRGQGGRLARSSRSASCRRSCPSTTRASGSAATTATPPSTTRSSSPAARTSTSTSRARPGSGSPPTATRSPPSRRARRCSCTCRSRPSEFAAHWNAAQALSAPQVALGGELAVLLRQAAARRDPHRAVQAGHRHPARSS